MLLPFEQTPHRRRRPSPRRDPSMALDETIAQYTLEGWRVTYATETSAQLVRPKTFSFVAALLWFLLLGVGVFVYLAYYLAKRDDQVFLAVAPDGQINETYSKPDPRAMFVLNVAVVLVTLTLIALPVVFFFWLRGGP